MQRTKEFLEEIFDPEKEDRINRYYRQPFARVEWEYEEWDKIKKDDKKDL